MSNLKQSVQGFGRFLSGMVIPNIGAFIAWGLITALFIETGWLPRIFPNSAGVVNFSKNVSTLVGPMLQYLIPLLIAYTGGKLVGGLRGGVIGAIAAVGVIIGANITMILGAMIMGPLAGLIIKKVDEFFEDKIPPGFEMLINNFSLGIIGAILAVLGYLVIGPAVQGLTNALSAGVQFIVDRGLLPLVSIFIEPGKILFLNNAINHGILDPLGLDQVQKAGKSIFFLLETNPGPGLGVLLAYYFFSKGSAKQSSVGAIIIHFLGGIHEIYFPYVLMNPWLIISCIAGGFSGILTYSILGIGLVGPPSPGSIFALSMMSPPGDLLKVWLGVLVATVVSFLVSIAFVKRAASKMTDEDLEAAKSKVSSMKAESKGQQVSVINPKSIVYACDAGMGSSAMGASMLRKRLRDKGYDIPVKNYAINEIPKDTSIVVTHEQLAKRAELAAPNAYHIAVKDFLDMSIADELEEILKNNNAPEIKSKEVETSYISDDLLKKENILVNQMGDTKERSIEKAGNILYGNGYVESSYVVSMLRREKDISTYMGKGIAIPHGEEAAKKSIKKSGVSIVLYPDGVDFGGNKAYIVVGIAGKENEHLGIISKIAEILDKYDENGIKQIACSRDANYILSLFK